MIIFGFRISQINIIIILISIICLLGFFIISLLKLLKTNNIMKTITTIYGLNPIEFVNITILLIPFIFMILHIIGINFFGVKRSKESKNLKK